MREFLIAVGILWILSVVIIIWMAATAPPETEIWKNGEPRG
jgi:hypothetical protein